MHGSGRDFLTALRPRRRVACARLSTAALRPHAYRASHHCTALSRSASLTAVAVLGARLGEP